MALPICTPSISCSMYGRNSKPITMSSLASCSCSSSSTSLHSSVKVSNFTLSSRFSQMGLCHFGSWNGLRHMGISISPCPQKIRRRNRCKGKVVHASLFGVGAPEALVIGAVALLVFGPKGLAEVAQNLGKTLRAFQPTIKELQEVSREFKNTLEREIGLDDDLSSRANTSNQSSSSVEKSQTDPNGTPSNNAYNDDPLKIIKEHLNAPAAAPQDLSSSPPETQVEIGSQSQDSNPPSGAMSSEDQLEITEEQLEAPASTQEDVASSPPSPPSKIEEESEPQVAIQETAVAGAPIQKPETET